MLQSELSLLGASAPVPVTRSSAPSSGALADLRRECEVFSVFLGDYPVTPYVAAKYLAGQAALPAHARRGTEPLDALLLRTGRRGGFALRSADMYARLFHPGSLLRQKLVLLLAIQESCAPGSRELDSAITGSRLGIVLGVAGQVLASLAALGVGLLRFGLPSLVWRALPRRGPREGA